LLAANELFSGLDDDVMAEVEAMTNLTTCPAGQLIYEPDSTGEVLFFLKKGNVQIYRLSADGKKLIVGDVKPGSFFGEMSLLGQAMSGNFAEANRDSLLCAMSRSDVHTLLLAHPDIAERVIEHLATRLRDAEARLETLAYQRLEARLASALLRECDPADDTVHGFTQQDLAEMVGASRESVTRLLTQMAKARILEVKRRQIRLLDPDALRDLTSTTEHS
jgi:CRP-like cAMP-binding protein